MPSSITLHFNHYDKIADKLHEATKALNKVTGFNVEHRAKEKAAVDTGFFRAAYYTVTDASSGFASAAADAASLNAKAVMLEEEPPPDKDTTVIVVNGASYSVPLEYGTGRMAAQPSLTPAVEDERPDWEHALRTLERLK